MDLRSLRGEDKMASPLDKDKLSVVPVHLGGLEQWTRQKCCQVSQLVWCLGGFSIVFHRWQHTPLMPNVKMLRCAEGKLWHFVSVLYTLSHQSACVKVPTDSPSWGGDVRVCVFWKKPSQLFHSFWFCSWHLFLSLQPFQLYLIP